MSLLIKNGTILTASGQFQGDIYVEGETIREIGLNIARQADEVIDATGKLVMPGGVDEHVHYGSFGGLLFDTAGAAAVGGTTTIVDFAPQERGVPLLDAIRRQAAKAQDVCPVDFAFHAVIMDPKESVFEEVRHLPEIGVATLKLFMAYKGTDFYCDDDAILQAMLSAREAGVTMMVHAENADIISMLTQHYIDKGKTSPVYHYHSRPPLAEEEATNRAIALAKASRCPLYVVHVSIREAMQAIRQANQEGWPIYGETCTHYLTLTTDYLAKPGFEGAKYVCSPPLRPQEHLDALWQALAKGWLLGVGSDHCALDGGFEGAKKKGIKSFAQIPNGCPGVQDRLALLWTYGVCTGKLSEEKFVDVFATAPAKVVGLYPQKGQIAVGSDADIVVFDPTWRGTITNEQSLHGIDYEPFEGFQVQGRAERVYLRGRLAAQCGKLVAKPGNGRWQKCAPYGLCYHSPLPAPLSTVE